MPLKDLSEPKIPLVLKPQKGGARSPDTYIVRNTGELERYRRFVDEQNCVAQEYIEGDTFTCGSVNLDGHCHGVIVMRRTLRSGDT